MEVKWVVIVCKLKTKLIVTNKASLVCLQDMNADFWVKHMYAHTCVAAINLLKCLAIIFTLGLFNFKWLDIFLSLFSTVTIEILGAYPMLKM